MSLGNFGAIFDNLTEEGEEIIVTIHGKRFKIELLNEESDEDEEDQS